MKRCFKCLTEKPLSAFYRHAAMGDGHLGKCKECTRKDVRENRIAKMEFYRQYDRLRASAPHRVAARSAYYRTPAGKASHRRAVENWMEKYPERRKASHIVNNALRGGKLVKLPCFMCGEDAQAHHPDYSAPLDVVWLCPKHHAEVHKMAEAA